MPPKQQQLDGLSYFETGDLLSFNNWTELFSGVDTVIHLCALVHQMDNSPSRDDYRKANSELPTKIASMASECGVEHFIFLSSVKAVGEQSIPGCALDESSKCSPEDPYGASKLEAENSLTALAQSNKIALTILRPPLIYGPEMKANMLRLFGAIHRRLPLPLGGVKNSRSVLYIENLTSALEAIVFNSAKARGCFFVSDKTAISTPELVNNIAKGLSVKHRNIALPVPLLTFAGAMLGKTPLIHKLTSSLEINSTKLQTQMHWEPPYSTQEGISKTAKWFLER
jgi:nucleoside-diphosphate-sugar epimerase